MESGQVSREFLRIAGGYGALAEGNSPAGGLDIDNSGHFATDGDVTVDGNLSAGGGALVVDQATALVTAQNLTIEQDFSITGRDLTWSQYLHAADGFPTSISGCSPVSQTQVRLREVEYRSLDFDNSLDQRAIFNFVLPPNYQGGSLKVELFWTYSVGTAGGNTRWIVNILNLSDNDPMNQDVNPGFAILEDTAIAVHDLHKITLTLTPVNAIAGDYCNVVVVRNSNHAGDTFDNFAQFISLRISNT